MSKTVKPLVFALAAAFAAAAWMPAQAADQPYARETHGDVKKDRMDIHKDVMSLRAALHDHAKDLHALAVARHAHNKEGIEKATTDLKSDNVKIRKMRMGLQKDRMDLHKDLHPMGHPMHKKMNMESPK